MRRAPNTRRGIQMWALLVAGILAGSVLVQPAVAHVTTGLKHLTRHLDGIYVNESQVASDLDPRYVNELQIASDLDARYVNEGNVGTRFESCAGLTFYPTDSTTDYTNAGTVRHRTSTNGSGVFRCDPKLPHGAVITGVDFRVFDTSATAEVSGCNLKRVELGGSAPDTTPGSAPATGVAETPGHTTVSAPSISSAVATVDNDLYAYWLECSTGPDATTGIVGASIAYTITAANG